MNIGDKVYAKSFMIEGYGTIIDIVSCNFYPVQVEMDEGDTDGHRIYRFSRNEIRIVSENWCVVDEHRKGGINDERRIWRLFQWQ